MMNSSTILFLACFALLFLLLLSGCDKPREDPSATGEIATSGGIVITGSEPSDQTNYDPKFIEAYNAALSAEDYARAENLAAELVSKHGHDANALVALGLPLLMQGRFEKAIVNFDKAIKIEPRNSTALYNRGFAAWQLRDFENAMHYYRRTLDIDKDYPEAHYGMAAASEKLGMDSLVIEHASRFLELKSVGAFVPEAKTMLESAKKRIREKR